jgi:bifunctional ADP-heptose synthase (sugar kinase/adenylyltransferase)
MRYCRGKVAVVGDLILDEYIVCEVLGISPEDDFALNLRVAERRFSLGGAANVAHNLAKIGDIEVHLFGRTHDTGSMRYGKFRIQLRKTGINFHPIIDTVDIAHKQRFISVKGRQLARINDEQKFPMDGMKANEFGRKFREYGKYDLVVVSDYKKGFITEEVMSYLTNEKVIVDPKGTDFEKYGSPFIITPNESEWGPGHDAEHEIVTCSWNGSKLYSRLWSGEMTFVSYHPTNTREVGDPTGCGDSFVAGLVRALLIDDNVGWACGQANAAGACAFDHIGSHAVTKEEIEKELASFKYYGGSSSQI